MKNIWNLLLNITLVIFFAGCNTEEFLTEANPNNLNADSFWKNTADVDAGLLATYGALQFQGVMGATATTQLPVRSDTGRPNNWNATARSLQTLAFNDNTEVVKTMWDDCYEGVYRANQVLEHLDAVSNADKRLEIEAQAHFLRGLFNYFLFQSYNKGSIILHTVTPKTVEDFNKSLAPRELVFDSILKDFEFAADNLPEVWPISDQGRATWGAATAMLGKLWINEKEYAKALPYFKSIVERPDLYSLAPDISWNFDEDHEWNPESIFEIAFDSSLKGGNTGGADDGSDRSEGTNRNYILGTTQSGGYRVIMPSYWITMLYKEDPMDMTDPRYEADDVYTLRTSASIAIADDTGTTLYQRPSDEGGGYNNKEASYVKKSQNWQLEREPLITGNSGINERLIRLADIYLLYAETLLMTGGSYTEALDLINLIRDRAGAMDLVESDYTAATLMEHIMWVERPLELMFEGHDTRWEDLRRWGKTREQYERLSLMKFTLEGKNIRWYEPADKDTDSEIVQEFIEAAEIYNPELHDYFPIPVTEQLTNPNFGD